MIRKTFSVISLFVLSLFVISCSSDDDISLAQSTLTPSEVLSSVPWITTTVKDANGNSLSLDSKEAVNYVGYAYYRNDGLFRIINFQVQPKIHGFWSVSADGKTRTLEVQNSDGSIAYTRVVDILELTDKVFTYRIVPDADNPSVYYDVVHVPTDHVEPPTPADILGSVVWITTKVTNSEGQVIPNEDPEAAGYVGYAYYDLEESYGKDLKNGNFRITSLDNTLRISGTWYVPLDGKKRILNFNNMQRIVDIIELNPGKFIYRIYTKPEDASYYLDVEHIPNN